METVEQARETIFKELTSDDTEIRSEYLKLFEAEAKAFADPMAQAFIKWRTFDNAVEGNEKRAYVSALVYTAITLHVLSMKLFLSGQTVAAGNLSRQVIESIALSILCSCKDLNVLGRFMNDQYSTSGAVQDVIKHSKKMSLNREALQSLKMSQDFYHRYSHVTKATLAIGMSFTEEGGLYIGATFDKGKVEAYTREIKRRHSLAKVFPDFIDGVADNVAKW